MKRGFCPGILVFFISLVMAGCSSGTTPLTSTTTSSSSTTTTSALPCETNDTAGVVFQNLSTTNLTFDVIWDGAKITTLSPGSWSAPYTVASGAHTLTFKIANTNQVACSFGTVNVAQCKYYTYPCGT
jgi:hypothetical protein